MNQFGAKELELTVGLMKAGIRAVDLSAEQLILAGVAISKFEKIIQANAKPETKEPPKTPETPAPAVEAVEPVKPVEEAK